MIRIRSCRSWSQNWFSYSNNRSKIIPFQRYLTTSNYYPASPKAEREVPTPLVLLSVSKWENKQDGESIYHAFIKYFTKYGWNVTCIDLDPTEGTKSRPFQRNQKSLEILTRLKSVLIDHMRSTVDRSGPFPPLLVSYGFSTLIAEEYVSSHPLSGLALINPPLAPVHAHQDRPDIFPTNLGEFDYEPTFPIVVARSKEEAGKIEKSSRHRIEFLQNEELKEVEDLTIEKREWDLDSAKNVEGGPIQLRIWANENGMAPREVPEWFSKGDYIRNDINHKREPLILDEKHLEESFVRGSGPGGQAVNKLNNCVFLKHLPTGKSVKCQESRSRDQNRILARRKLGKMLELLVFGKFDSAIGKKQLKIRNRKRIAMRKSKKKRAETEKKG